MNLPDYAKADIETTVAWALKEDIGNGDITAQLIPAEQQAIAKVITREKAVICGQSWVNEVFRQVDPTIKLNWKVNDGDKVYADKVLFEANGPARSILTGERAALNFLQLLSGTATRCLQYAEIVQDTQVKLLDTRKTIPGLRTAQKYAVTCGGCFNHRLGLYDAFLIKENHIAACGGIAQAVSTASSQQPGKKIEVEVEGIEELIEALDAKADIIMLDNFSVEDIHQAVKISAGKAKLEASGNITKETIREVAETGVDFISIGGLTKNCSSIDLSMRLKNI